MTTSEITLPIKTQTEGNSSEHYRVKAKRARMQRYVTQLILLSKFGRVRPAFPLVVTLTRVSSGSLDPHDNLPGSQKHLVDQIAEWLGLKNDWDPRVQWRYAQEKCARGSFSVRVKFETVAEIVPHY